ncbi:MAG: hypothetical protein IJV54_07240 [Bacteroidales bacterium]|nr:hypothetical protein [Bacteroidales bacterium]
MKQYEIKDPGGIVERVVSSVSALGKVMNGLDIPERVFRMVSGELNQKYAELWESDGKTLLSGNY